MSAGSLRSRGEHDTLRPRAESSQRPSPRPSPGERGGPVLELPKQALAGGVDLAAKFFDGEAADEELFLMAGLAGEQVDL